MEAERKKDGGWWDGEGRCKNQPGDCSNLATWRCAQPGGERDIVNLAELPTWHNLVDDSTWPTWQSCQPGNLANESTWRRETRCLQSLPAKTAYALKACNENITFAKLKIFRRVGHAGLTPGWSQVANVNLANLATWPTPPAWPSTTQLSWNWQHKNPNYTEIRLQN